MTTTPALTQTPKSPALILTSAIAAQAIDNSGVVTNHQLLYTAGASGAIVKSLLITSNDTAARYATAWIQPGGTGAIIPLGTVAVPATAGLSATGILQNIDVLGNPYLTGLAIDNSGKPCLLLEAGTKLFIGLVAALTANKAMFIFTQAEDF